MIYVTEDGQASPDFMAAALWAELRSQCVSLPVMAMEN